MWLRKKAHKSSTFWRDYYSEQINRIRRGEPIAWLLGTPSEIVLRSQEIDRLNARLDKVERLKAVMGGFHVVS